MIDRYLPGPGVIRGRRLMRVALLAFSAALVASLSACAASTPPRLRDAIQAVLDAPNLTLVSVDELRPNPPYPPRTVLTTVLEKPDRVSSYRTNGPNEIAIGSTRYLEAGGAWHSDHDAGASAALTNNVLLFLHRLERATGVVRHGQRYVVSSAEASRLLRSTEIATFRHLSDVSWSATERDGQLTSMRLHFRSASGDLVPGTPLTATITITITVSRVGTSPPITAPPTKKKS